MDDSMFKTIFWILIVAAVGLVGAGFHRTSKVKSWPEQEQFLSGHIPASSPEGFYKGSQTLSSRTSWEGKIFFPESNTGINRFGGTEKYPFKTYTGKGVQDTELETFKIDYQVEGNPFWVRPVVDEVVEVGPGKFLGKVHYRFIPGHPFTIGYFSLEKE